MTKISPIKKGPLSLLTKTKLRNYLWKGRTYSDIGKEFGVTRSAVHQLAVKFEFKGIKSGLLYARNLRIMKMYANKIPVEKIAKYFNLSKNQTYIIIRSMPEKMNNNFKKMLHR